MPAGNVGEIGGIALRKQFALNGLSYRIFNDIRWAK
jgi:hypothetical protein